MNRNGCLSIFKKILLFTVGFLTLLLAGFALYNLSLPSASKHPEVLENTDLLHIREANHLRHSLGDKIWKGWGSQTIPIVLYNEKYAFLYGLDKAEAGWKRFPYEEIEGGPWMASESGKYYWQPLKKGEPSPQAFIVETGDYYAASMTTFQWSKVRLIQTIQEELPGIVSPVFPYGIFLSRFTGEWHISAILHESFHSYQAQMNREKLKQSENSLKFEGDYLWDNPEFREKWLNERKFLADIISREGFPNRDKLNQWLDLRSERRKMLTEDLIKYEQLREWSEGLAKYVENQSLKQAGSDLNYEPITVMGNANDFGAYREWQKIWDQEINQLESNLQFSETIFYYSGWAQAEILDRLDPGWKNEAMNSGFFMDDHISNLLKQKGF